MLRKILLCTLAGIVFITVSGYSVSVAYAQGAAAGKTIWDGVFTEEQAVRGAVVFKASCISCHLANFSGGNGILLGDRFMYRFREDTLQNLFLTTQARMPRNSPGSLTPEQYLDAVAFILLVNGAPGGSQELKADVLSSIMIVGKNGPQPFPAGAMIRVYGCIAQDPAGKWILTNGTRPSRTREPVKSSDAELKAAASVPAGAVTYRLEDWSLHKAPTFKGKRVEAKGLYFAPPDEGISLSALTEIAPTCQ